MESRKQPSFIGSQPASFADSTAVETLARSADGGFLSRRFSNLNFHGKQPQRRPSLRRRKKPTDYMEFIK